MSLAWWIERFRRTAGRLRPLDDYLNPPEARELPTEEALVDKIDALFGGMIAESTAGAASV